MQQLTIDRSCSAAGIDGQALLSLVDVIEKLAFARDMATVVTIVRDAARSLSQADGVTFVLRAGSLCHYVDEDAIAPLWKGKRFPMTDCISGWCMLNRKTAVIPDIYRDHRIPHDAYRPTFVKSLVMVPVGADDSVAAIGAYWARTLTPDASLVRTLEILARSTATAIASVTHLEKLLDSISAAKEAEAQQRILVAELNHRVKNNMQMLYAMMQTAQRRAKKGEAFTALVEATQRIGAMAAAQHGLYDVEDPTGYSADQFLTSACALARSSFGSHVDIRIDHAEGRLPASTAMPLALILNELLTNAVKHGIGDRQSGSVSIGLSQGAHDSVLVVQDDGPGFDFTISRSSTSGLGLVTGLARQLNGKFYVAAGKNGARCVVHFSAGAN
jgi:two-component sensor histidine kinase